MWYSSLGKYGKGNKMNKRIGHVMMLVTVMVSLAACGKKIEAKLAAEAFVNTEFYLKDFDAYEKAFGQKIDEKSKKSVKNDLSKQLEVYGIKAEHIHTVAY